VNFFDPSVRQRLLERVSQLTPASQPKFGKMNVNQMVVHCAGGVEMMMGELQVAPKPGPFRVPLLRYLVIHVLPWPKGAPTAPELLPQPNPGDFAENLSKLKSAIERAGARGPQGSFSPHPMFGQLSVKDLSALLARHLDHHLSQFGV
jgi:Protein of unknown function (DUF1569)